MNISVTEQTVTRKREKKERARSKTLQQLKRKGDTREWVGTFRRNLSIKKKRVLHKGGFWIPKGPKVQTVLVRTLQRK